MRCTVGTSASLVDLLTDASLTYLQVCSGRGGGLFTNPNPLYTVVAFNKMTDRFVNRSQNTKIPLQVKNVSGWGLFCQSLMVPFTQIGWMRF